VTETRLVIGGEQVPGAGDPLEVENPYTEETIASVALPSSEQVDAAITGAREAAVFTKDPDSILRWQEGLEAFQETKHVHIETQIALKEWWYPYGSGPDQPEN
jgi:acyl-CoA reductase-like NAD-dependent aldehyde dehydrogenase